MRLAIDNAENQGQIAKKLVGLLGARASARNGVQQRVGHALWGSSARLTRCAAPRALRALRAPLKPLPREWCRWDLALQMAS